MAQVWSGMAQGGGGGGGEVPTGRKNQKVLECSKSGDVHVVYSSNSDEWGAMLASAYSALRNTYNPNRLLFHLIIPHTNDADELCSMIRIYAQAYPDVVRMYAALPLIGSLRVKGVPEHGDGEV
jgi:hypothetical protein